MTLCCQCSIICAVKLNLNLFSKIYDTEKPGEFPVVGREEAICQHSSQFDQKPLLQTKLLQKDMTKKGGRGAGMEWDMVLPHQNTKTRCLNNVYSWENQVNSSTV